MGSMHPEARLIFEHARGWNGAALLRNSASNVQSKQANTRALFNARGGYTPFSSRRPGKHGGNTNPPRPGGYTNSLYLSLLSYYTNTSPPYPLYQQCIQLLPSIYSFDRSRINHNMSAYYITSTRCFRQFWLAYSHAPSPPPLLTPSRIILEACSLHIIRGRRSNMLAGNAPPALRRISNSAAPPRLNSGYRCPPGPPLHLLIALLRKRSGTMSHITIPRCVPLTSRPYCQLLRAPNRRQFGDQRLRSVSLETRHGEVVGRVRTNASLCCWYCCC